MSKKRVRISSGSVYADLGYKDYKEMEIKANLVFEINTEIKKKN